MKSLVILALLLNASTAFGSSCKELLSSNAFMPSSLKTNANSIFDPAELKGKNPSTDHLQIYAEPLRGVLMKATRVFVDSVQFRTHLLSEYGLENRDLRFKPFLNKKIEKIRIQKLSLLTTLMKQLAQREAQRSLTYEWVISTTIRMSTQLDIFPLTNMDDSLPVKKMAKDFKINLLKRLFDERLLEDNELSDWESLYQNLMTRDENGGRYWSEVTRIFPDHISLSYMGPLSDQEMGNAVIQGVHYFNILPGQSMAHGGYFSTYVFARHDYEHQMLIYMNTMATHDDLETWGKIKPIRSRLLQYIDQTQPSTQHIQELQKMLFVILHELPKSLEILQSALLRGEITNRQLEIYLSHAEEGLIKFDAQLHKNAIQQYFNWARQN